MESYESTMWIPAKDGVGIAPRTLTCPECGDTMLRRPGHRYVCRDCETETTLDLTPLEHKRFSK